MAGVRSKALTRGRHAGKVQGWFKDHTGRRVFFVGTRSRPRTLKIAQRLEDEHREMALGYRPIPAAAEAHRADTWEEAAAAYFKWGKAQGGRGGRRHCHPRWLPTTHLPAQP